MLADFEKGSSARYSSGDTARDQARLDTPSQPRKCSRESLKQSCEHGLQGREIDALCGGGGGDCSACLLDRNFLDRTSSIRSGAIMARMCAAHI